MTQTTRVDVYEQIAAQVALGKGPREVARRLDALTVLDIDGNEALSIFISELELSGMKKPEVERRAASHFKKLLRELKLTVAWTEMRRATSQVQAEQALATGAKMKVWITAGDECVRDVCQANEAQGPIPIAQAFVGGVQHAPQLPRCRCTVSYYSNTALNDVYKRRADERAAITAAAKANLTNGS